MKKTLLVTFCFLLIVLLLGCPSGGSGGSTTGIPPVANDVEPITVKDVEFRRPINSNIKWFFSQYRKRISMSLREDAIAEFYIIISENGSFENYIAKFSDNSVCSFLNSENILQLNRGRNLVSIKGNEEGYTVLNIYGIDRSGREVRISGDGVANNMQNRELEISVYSRNYVEVTMNIDDSEYDEEEKDAWYAGTYTDTLMGDILNAPFAFPNQFSLDDGHVGYLAHRHQNHNRHQGNCGSCTYFSAIGLLEIEAKRFLIEERDFQFSKYDIDLSEEELLTRRNYTSGGAIVRRNLMAMGDNGWIIPLERHNVYDATNCDWASKSAVSHSSGVKIGRNNVVSVGRLYTRTNSDRNRIEGRVKALLFYYHKAVSVSVKWPKNSDDWVDVLKGSETFGGRHAVNIIGWDDNYIDDNGKAHGKVWIAQNSHGNSRAKFYIKMGNTGADARQYVYVSRLNIERYDDFINDILNERNPTCEITCRRRDCNQRTWNEGLSRDVRAGRTTRAELLSSSRVRTITKFAFTKNPKAVFPNIANIPSLAPQIWPSDVEVHKIVFRVQKKGTSYRPYFARTIGISAMHPNPFLRYARIENETENYVDFSTYSLYFRRVNNVAGQLLFSDTWIPAKPEDVTIGYTYRPFDDL